MIEVKNCPACASSHLSEIKEYYFSPPSFINDDAPDENTSYIAERLWIFFKKLRKGVEPAVMHADLCEDCGFIFTNPRFTEADIGEKYKTVAVLPSAKKRAETNEPQRHEQRAARIYSLLENCMRRTGRKGETLKVLDLGGAEGYNLYSFAEKGHLCFLLDYVKKDISKRITYLGKNLDDISTEDKFDIILLCHTLEHVPAPFTLVKDISEHLNEGGLLYIEVPLGAWQEWSRLQEPLTHVNFFSEESAYELVRRAGLRTVHLSTDFQWVTHYKLWCVNLVAGKGVTETVNTFRSTRSQMKYLPYAFLMFLKDPGRLLRSLRYRLLGKSK